MLKDGLFDKKLTTLISQILRLTVLSPTFSTGLSTFVDRISTNESKQPIHSKISQIKSGLFVKNQEPVHAAIILGYGA